MLKAALFATGVVLMTAGLLVRRYAESQRRGAELLAHEREYQRWLALRAVRNGRVTVEEAARV